MTSKGGRALRWLGIGGGLLGLGLLAVVYTHKEVHGHSWAYYGHLTSNRRLVLKHGGPHSSGENLSEEFTVVRWGEHAGKRDGGYRQYWNNGQLWYEGGYRLGRRGGTWRKWSSEGELLEERDYVDGRQVAVRDFAPERAADEPDTPIPIASRRPDFELGEPDEAELDDFALLDQDGRMHELYRLSDYRAVVLYVHGVECPIVRQQSSTLRALMARFAEEPVAFLFLNANPQDDRASIRAELETFGLDVPVLMDPTQIVARDLELTRTAEALVIDTDGWKLAYRGPVDDRVGYETQKAEAEHAYLADALDVLLAGETVAEPRIAPAGCKITFLDPIDPARISYTDDIVPLLEEHCLACHRPAAVGPWSMTSLDKLRGWNAMIRETVMTRRMPPHFVDTERSPAVADLGLSDAELRTLVAWLDAGAPGDDDGEDRLPGLVQSLADESEWMLGEPDLVVTLPVQAIPATGTLPWTYVDAEYRVERDRWIRAVDFLPSNAQVMHHAAAFIEYPKHLEHLQPEYRAGLSGYLAMYLPGKAPEKYPPGTAVFLPRGGMLRFQLHYTTIGVEAKDQPRLALYFADETPRQEMQIAGAFDNALVIPPGVREHPWSSEWTFDEDVEIHGLFPHMHYRGRHFEYKAVLPSGEELQLASMPNYRFDWQMYYALAQPLDLPAGTRIVCNGLFDNSPSNPFNPDPTATVEYGAQSWDEMFVGWIYYTAKDCENVRRKSNL